MARRGGTSPLRLARLASLVVLAVLLQTIVFPNLRILGVVPDVALVMTVAVAYEAGPETGALFGFLQGLAIDLFVNTPFGLTAIVLVLTAFLVGVFQEALVRIPRFMPVVVSAGAGLVGGALFVGIGGLLGEEHLYDWDSLRIVAMSALYGALLAPALFPLARRALRAPVR